MATDVGTLLMKINADTKNFEKGVAKTTKAFKGLIKGLAVGSAAGVASLVAIGTKSVNLAQEQEKADARLEAIAKKVTKATDEQVQSLKDLAAAQQQVSTFGDEVLIAGQSQLLSFGLQADQAGELTESLANLLAATKGMEATQEDAIGAANLLGKAFSGQVGALSKAGILLDETQASILKNGTEAEKTAALVDIMNQNYGGLAETLAETSEGQMIQVKNALGDIGETIGNILIPWISKAVSFVADHLPEIETFFTNTFTAVDKAIQFTTDFIQNKVIPIFMQLKDDSSNAMETIQPIAERVFAVVLDVAKTLYEFYRDNLIKIFEALKAFWDENGEEITQTVVTVFENIITVAEKMWTFYKDNILPIIQEFIDAVIENFPIIWDTVQTVFGGIIEVATTLWEIFRDNLLPIFESLYNYIRENVDIGDVVKDVFTTINIIIEATVGTIVDLVNILQTAIDKFKEFRNASDKKVSAPTVVEDTTGGGTFFESSGDNGGFFEAPVSGQRANGGPVQAGKSYLVGERGTETFTPSTNGVISPAGAGANITINVNGSGDPNMVANEIVRILNQQGIVRRG